jgi:secreted trypsin-like serine protease
MMRSPAPSSTVHAPLSVILIALSLATACTAQPGPQRVATTTAAIQGGEPAPAASFDFAVAIVGDGLCSGTLIAPNLALTARHCVESRCVRK